MSIIAELIIGGVVSLLFGYIAVMLKKQGKVRDSMREGAMLMLKVQLIEYHSKWKKRKFVTRHGLSNFTEMHSAYRNLGGNGMIEQLFEEIKTLEIKEGSHGEI
ncbi:MAG: hypothetical protein FWE25_03230 [Lachnospiraceae bacterium]|nr:hypothetical protein [Lachnospiraceae bacterium]